METKQCNSCNTIKTIINFSIKRSNQDGYNNICKLCIKDRDIKYNRSIDGIVTKLYNAHRSRAKTENYQLLYTKEQFRIWLLTQKNFNEIYKRWIEKDYHIDYYPSVTKIDTAEHYSISNIQLLGWRDKLDKDHIKALKNRSIRKEENRIKANERLAQKKLIIKSILIRTHKICGQCHIDKDIEDYYKNSNSIDRKSNTCMACSKKNAKEFVKTKNGTAYRIYKKQVQKSKLRGHNPPAYTFEQFKSWLFNQDLFHSIYNTWVENGYKTLQCVSCDRTNRHKGYSFDNITVTTWKDNRDRWFKYRL